MSVNMKLIRVVTNQSRLAAGRPDDPEFWGRVQGTLAEWEAELVFQGIQMELVQTDELAGGSRDAEAEHIRQHLMFLQEGEKADYALILGGDDVVPFYQLDDPVEDVTNDGFIYSDDPYASYEDNYLYKPRHPIGRFPHGQGQHDDLVIELLQRSIRYHRQSWDAVHRVAFTAQAWRQQSQATWPGVNYWHECPPWRLPSAPHDPAPACLVASGLLVDKTLHYYNLHGQKDDTWLGECACEWMSNAHSYGMSSLPCLPPALGVAQIPPLPPAIIFSGACYSGFTVQSQPKRNPALRFLRQGAVAFIGASARSYMASPAESLKYSDLLAHSFLRLLEENQVTSPQRRIGEIVQTVKSDYQPSHRFYQHQRDVKTLWEFILYGDPTLIPFRRLATQEKSHDSDRQQHA